MSCFQILGMGPGGPSSAATSFWGLDVPLTALAMSALAKSARWMWATLSFLFSYAHSGGSKLHAGRAP